MEWMPALHTATVLLTCHCVWHNSGSVRVANFINIGCACTFGCLQFSQEVALCPLYFSVLLPWWTHCVRNTPPFKLGLKFGGSGARMDSCPVYGSYMAGWVCTLMCLATECSHSYFWSPLQPLSFFNEVWSACWFRAHPSASRLAGGACVIHCGSVNIGTLADRTLSNAL